MSNKKDASQWIFPLMMFIFLIILFTIAVYSCDKLEFKIYKTECYDVINVAKYQLCIDECYSMLQSSCEKLCVNNAKEQTCQRNEIKEKSLEEAWNICWHDNISRKDFMTCSIMEEGKLDFLTDKTAKQWFFDEFCECSLATSPCGNNDCFWKTEKDFIEHCKEYKCGDYIVEVIK